MTTIATLLSNIKNLVKKYHYTKTEVDSALEDKLDTADAFSGSYNDLTNKPSSYSAGDVVDATAHANIGTTANATQAQINSAVDGKFAAIGSIEVIKIDTADANGAPTTTASAETMNKIYLTKPTSGKDDNYNEFVTVKSGDEGNYTYAWEKFGSISLDLSGYYTKTEADNTFLAQADFIDTLNTAVTNMIAAEQ